MNSIENKLSVNYLRSIDLFYKEILYFHGTYKTEIIYYIDIGMNYCKRNMKRSL